MRRVFLDTETTGLSPEKGHRIVEIAAIAYENRSRVQSGQGGVFHHYLNPQRKVDEEAVKIHGLDDEFLAGQPFFADIAAAFVDFIRGGELIIHNAEFDRAFIDAEFNRITHPPLSKVVDKIVCSLEWSRHHHNHLRRHSLDALCDHFGVDNSHRTTHNALVDTELLADVYFRMIQQQMKMDMQNLLPTVEFKGAEVRVLAASDEEMAMHQEYLRQMREETGVAPIFNDGARE